MTDFRIADLVEAKVPEEDDVLGTDVFFIDLRDHSLSTAIEKIRTFMRRFADLTPIVTVIVDEIAQDERLELLRSGASVFARDELPEPGSVYDSLKAMLAGDVHIMPEPSLRAKPKSKEGEAARQACANPLSPISTEAFKRLVERANSSSFGTDGRDSDID